MVHTREDPPTDWCRWWPGLTRLNDDIYFGWPDLIDGDTNPYFWHWCPTAKRWSGQSTASHIVLSEEPLHMEPSLLWPCCGLHGFVRDQRWFPA